MMYLNNRYDRLIIKWTHSTCFRYLRNACVSRFDKSEHISTFAHTPPYVVMAQISSTKGENMPVNEADSCILAEECPYRSVDEEGNQHLLVVVATTAWQPSPR